jgi:hypothetical protein
MTEETAIFNVWSQRDLGVDLSAAKIFETISDADLEYVCNNNYPFLQLINTNAIFGEESPVKFITASTGWVIHDYGEAISVSAPHSLRGDTSNVSIMEQAKIAEEVAKLIAEKGWHAIELIAGTNMMKRFMWIESKRIKFTLNGYTPTANDEKCHDRLLKRAKDMRLVWEHAVIKSKTKDCVSTAE